MDAFSVLLVRSQLRKSDLARIFRRTRGTVSRWTDESVPWYVIEYLKLFIEVQRYRP